MSIPLTVAITDHVFPSLDPEEAILKPAGVTLVVGRDKSAAALIEVVADADAVITQFAPVTAEVIAAMRKARVIVRYGIGVDNVDLDAAKAAGIPVCNVPSYCIDEVADHTLAMILAATRQIVPNHMLIQGGGWGLAVPMAGMKTLANLTVGIVGFGRIGRAVARRLKPFKCPRLVFDPIIHETVIQEAECESASWAELLATADVVTLHCPSTPATRRLINAESLAQMKPGAILVNLSRGDLVDTPAAVAALKSGHLGALMIDVCDVEPIPADSPLRALPNVVCSSHVASCSEKAVQMLRRTVATTAAAALRGELPPSVVNGVTQPRFRSAHS